MYDARRALTDLKRGPVASESKKEFQPRASVNLQRHMTRGQWRPMRKPTSTPRETCRDSRRRNRPRRERPNGDQRSPPSAPVPSPNMDTTSDTPETQPQIGHNSILCSGSITRRLRHWNLVMGPAHENSLCPVWGGPNNNDSKNAYDQLGTGALAGRPIAKGTTDYPLGTRLLELIFLQPLSSTIVQQ